MDYASMSNITGRLGASKLTYCITGILGKEESFPSHTYFLVAFVLHLHLQPATERILSLPLRKVVSEST